MYPEPSWQCRAHGKLLLSGEYAVLDGALALALPTRFGQTFFAESTPHPGILHWIARDHAGREWFSAELLLPELSIQTTSIAPVADTLQQLLRACRRHRPGFLSGDTGWKVLTSLDFPRKWGLGTSSTLIASLARWAAVDPYALLFETMGGSGYDIACAFAKGPLLYRLDGRVPTATPVAFDPPFAGQLFFVFLDKKQNSREGIRRYRERVAGDTGFLSAISDLTRNFLEAVRFEDFTEAMLEHERLISRALDLPRAQTVHFPDFPGTIKSLGAWGGDFVLAASPEPPTAVREYFLKKGFQTCIPFREMVLPP